MSKIVDFVIGLAMGDAMGVPLEFSIRKKLIEHPVTSMLGYGSHDVPAGSWSDDTTMTICEIESFNKNNKFDYDDIMKNYIKWVMNGEFTPTGELFDIGRTCLKAIRKYDEGKTNATKCGSTSIDSNGNGSLMRTLPVALYSYYKNLDESSIIKLTNEMSSLTHGHDISKLGCYIYVRYIMFLIEGFTKEESYLKIKELNYSSYSMESLEAYERILKNDIKNYKLDDIYSSGYVVDTLEASLWVLLNTNSYKQAIIGAINLGQDTDTIGAIVGSMAGVIYGINDIPKSWLENLKRKDYLMDLALSFDDLIVPKIKDPVLGSSIGDIIGSVYEISDCKTNKNFNLFNKYDRFTDDTVMTFAVTKSFLNCNKNYKNLKKVSVETMTEIGRKYPKCGYGPSFLKWLLSEEHEPYGSYGNGAVMRISSIPMFSDNLEDIKKYCSIITNLSHNHEESIKGAESVCIVIYLIKNKKTKEEIKKYIEENYFKLNETVKSLAESKKKIIIKSLDTARASIQCFLESYDYEDAIRNAISIGGDSDTIAAITGGMAASYYGIPNDIYTTGLLYLDDYLRNIYDEYLKQTNLKWE